MPHSPEHPSSIPTDLHISRDSLSPRVRSYDDNLDTQARAIFLRNNLPHYNEEALNKATREGTITTEDLRLLRDLLIERDHIRRTGELPPEAKEKGIFIVKDAINPYQEALLAGGILDTDPSTQEHRDILINLPELLKADIDSYRASGLIHWADALELLKDTLSLTPEQQRALEAEIKDGAMVIFMPGALTQAETTPRQYTTSFTPVLIKDGHPQFLAPAYLPRDPFKKLITSKDPSLTVNVPLGPYLLLVKPTAQVPPGTTEKTVSQQIAELELMNKERALHNMPPHHSIKPAEYGALQQRFTQTIHDTAPGITTLTPLDDLRHSYTRFLDLPLSSAGLVPLGCFYPDSRQLEFTRYSADWKDARGGFRPVVRIELEFDK